MPFLLYYTPKSRAVNQKSVLGRTFHFQTCPSLIGASGRSIRYRQVLRTKQGSPFVPEKLVIEEKYPALYPTTIDTEIGEKMKAAILNEFEQWNSGYDAWAAIHFWDVTTDEAGEKTANNHMQFLHFVEDGDNVKVDMCWAK
jgi:hypothetical protein